MDSQSNQQKSATALHKYVLICVGCLFIFLGSFPIAYWRVSLKMSHQENLPPLPFKSLDWNEAQKANLPYPN